MEVDYHSRRSRMNVPLFSIATCLYFVTIFNIVFGCVNIDSKQKSICGCQTYSFMEKKGKRFYCERTKDYRDVIFSSNFPNDLISIQLSQNEITLIPKNFFPLEMSNFNAHVIELSLSRNKIIFIETGAFEGFSELQSLNLTYNQIGRLHQGMFKGLAKLSKLDLSHNTFPLISGDAFLHLTALNRLIISTDYLVCNCLMKDFFLWYSNANRKIKLKGHCQYPLAKRNVPLRKIARRARSLNCDNPTSLPLFQIHPHHDQVVFAGDNRSLYCEGADLIHAQLSWSLNGKEINKSIDDITEQTVVHSNRTTVASNVDLGMSTRFSGTWSCIISSNYSYDKKSVRLMVLGDDTVYCDRQQVINDYGTYDWPDAVTGATLFLNCTSRTSGDTRPQAERACMSGGVWSEGDYSRCPYVDPVARSLVQHFEDEKLSSGELVKACNGSWMTNPGLKVETSVGLELLASFMEECEKHMILHNDGIGRRLVDFTSLAMTSSRQVAIASQRSHGTADVIVDIIDETLQLGFDDSLSLYVQNAFNLAVAVSRADGDGAAVSCNVSISQHLTSLACHQTNKPVEKVSQAMIVVPMEDKKDIRIVIYRNDLLFQLTYQDRNESHVSTAADFNIGNIGTDKRHQVLVSPIYSISPLNGTRSHLNHLITMRFPTYEEVSLVNHQHHLAVWKDRGWEPVGDDCLVPRHPSNLTMIKCHWTGTYVILKNMDDLEDVDVHEEEVVLLLPPVYIGASLLCITSIVVAFTYIAFSSLLVSRENRHMIINIVIHLLLLTLIYVVGVRRVDHEILCYVTGLSLHYFSLSILVWLLLTARNLGKEMVASQQPQPAEPKPTRPILRFYLLACGIPIIICGITAAAKIQNYHDKESKYCWLTWETSIYAFCVPAAVTIISSLLILLRIFATLSGDMNEGKEDTSSPPTHVSENTPLHQQSRYTSSLSVTEKRSKGYGFGARLRGAALTFLLYTLTWVLAALTVAAPQIETSSNTAGNEEVEYSYQFSYVEEETSTLSTIFSYLFLIICFFTSVFLFYQHIASRADAVLCWKYLFHFRKRPHPIVGCHSDGIELVSNLSATNPLRNRNTSVAEELTLETVVPLTHGEETLRGTSSTTVGLRRESSGLPSSFITAGASGAECRGVIKGSTTGTTQPRERPCRDCGSQMATSGHPIKLTNLQMRDEDDCRESSITCHSMDESQMNMHTVPITWQRGSRNLESNISPHSRRKKIRKNLDARRKQARKRERKLIFLRGYAQDPLTSNEEGKERKSMGAVGVNPGGSVGLDEEKLQLLAIREYEKADEEERLLGGNAIERTYRPLLLSSPHREKDSPGRHLPLPRKRSTHNPNLVSNYNHRKAAKLMDANRKETFPLSPNLTSDSTSRIAYPPTLYNKGQSGAGINGEGKNLLEGQKSHNYLTTEDFHRNPFHFPAKYVGLSSSMLPQVASNKGDEVFVNAGDPLEVAGEDEFPLLKNETRM